VKDDVLAVLKGIVVGFAGKEITLDGNCLKDIKATKDEIISVIKELESGFNTKDIGKIKDALGKVGQVGDMVQNSLSMCKEAESESKEEFERLVTELTEAVDTFNRSKVEFFYDVIKKL